MNIKAPFTLAIVLTGIFLLVDNCGLQQPGVKNISSLGFDHTSALADNIACSTCHAQDRPPAPHDQVNECSQCHSTTKPWTTAVGGGNHTYPFDQTMGCINCHGVGGNFQDDFTPVNGTFKPISPNKYSATSEWSKGGFNHSASYGGTGDCINCHTQTSTAVSNITNTTARTWVGTGFYDHTGFGKTTNCLPCHGAGHNHDTSASNIGLCMQCHTPTLPVVTGPAPDYGGKQP